MDDDLDYACELRRAVEQMRYVPDYRPLDDMLLGAAAEIERLREEIRMADDASLYAGEEKG